MKDERNIPTSRLGRFARIAAAGVKTGASRVLGTDAGSAAHGAAELLGTLRGLAAKLGQMAAYVDGVVPDEHRESYEKAMRGLLSATPRSSSAEIRRIVEKELAAPMDQLFAEWEDHPMASASIGQVHRARLHDGRPVAVKVQHPGIIEAMESDLGNISMLESAVALLGARRFESRRLFEEVATRLREELDYSLEARNQDRFRELHAGDPTILIPAVLHDRSTWRVLTTELATGLSFDQACAAPELERQAWCRTLWRFVYKGNMVGGMFNADPHPGNYFFHEDGKITFIDFGCVQWIDEDKRLNGIALHDAAKRHDEAAFREAVRKVMDLQGGSHEQRTLRQVRDMYEPLFSSPYRITREYSSRLLRQMRELGNEARKVKHDEYVPLPKGILFMNRLQFGFYSILARLDAEVDYVAVEREFMG
jgi:predicted unusual protein kinase regulating ubiquinone biosynthesis (AarF/ABC1/UbiB family)